MSRVTAVFGKRGSRVGIKIVCGVFSLYQPQSHHLTCSFISTRQQCRLIQALYNTSRQAITTMSSLLSFSPSSSPPSKSKITVHVTPKSCLKNSLCVTAHNSTSMLLPPPLSFPHVHVHFPPPAVLCTTHLTHSKKMYNRRPMPVAPNVCTLPARRSGKIYYDEQVSHTMQNVQVLEPSRLPSLFNEHHILSSSESEDSDGFALCGSSMEEDGYISDIATVMDGMLLEFLPHPPVRDRSRSRSGSRSRSRSRSRSNEREQGTCFNSIDSDKQYSAHRKRSRKDSKQKEDERGRWKPNGIFALVKDEMEASCLGGF